MPKRRNVVMSQIPVVSMTTRLIYEVSYKQHPYPFISLQKDCHEFSHSISVADPGFPVGWAWTPEVAMFRKICMSKRKNWVP